MTQQVYRLELTERDVEFLRSAVGFLGSLVLERTPAMAWCDQMIERLRALEPVGTEGGS